MFDVSLWAHLRLHRFGTRRLVIDVNQWELITGQRLFLFSFLFLFLSFFFRTTSIDMNMNVKHHRLLCGWVCVSYWWEKRKRKEKEKNNSCSSWSIVLREINVNFSTTADWISYLDGRLFIMVKLFWFAAFIEKTSIPWEK